MGCDIHLFCEKQTKEGTWICVDHFKVSPHIKPDSMGIKTVEDFIGYLIPEPLYDGRNYAFFTMLAGVRRRSDVEQIAEIRGLPCDVSNLVKAFSDYWGCDGHSRSWYTAKELLEYRNQLEESLSKESSEIRRAYSALNNLCVNIMRRMVEVFHLYDSGAALEEIKENADKFRIVFWFDN